jgi:hypothetical protein
MNKAYKLSLHIGENDINPLITGKVSNEGYHVGIRIGWNDPTTNLVKLDIATEPDMIEIQGATLYRYPKLSLPRMKLDTLKEKYNVKVVRDPKKANYSIVSNKLIESLLTTSWENYYDKTYLAAFIKSFDPYVGKLVSSEFIAKLNELHDKLTDTCMIAIKSGYYHGTNATSYTSWRDEWQKASNTHQDSRLRGGTDVLLLNENVQQFKDISNNTLVLDKCINKICNQDSHIITEEEVVTTMQMLKSQDNDAISMGVELLANCNIEMCLDKVAYIWTMTYDEIRYAANWNTVNVKALRERLNDITPHSTQYIQLFIYERLIKNLVKEQMLTEWAWKTIRKTIHDNVTLKHGFGIKEDSVFNIDVESIKLSDSVVNCVIKEPSGEEIIEELTGSDGFDDLPF